MKTGMRCLIAILLAAVLLLGYTTVAFGYYILDSTDDQNLRSSPGGPIIRTLFNYEDVVLVAGISEGGVTWYQVGYAANSNYQSTGYITTNWQSPTDGGYAKDYVNIRESPSTSATILYTLSPYQYAACVGDRLTSVSTDRDWWYVTVPGSGNVGFLWGYWFDAQRE